MVSPPLKNMKVNWDDYIFQIDGKITNVPNHQSDFMSISNHCLSLDRFSGQNPLSSTRIVEVKSMDASPMPISLVLNSSKKGFQNEQKSHTAVGLGVFPKYLDISRLLSGNDSHSY